MKPFALQDFWPGMRVELHPATDYWMRGAKFGTVVSTGTKYVHVKLDNVSGIRNFVPRNISRLFDGPVK